MLNGDETLTEFGFTLLVKEFGGTDFLECGLEFGNEGLSLLRPGGLQLVGKVEEELLMEAVEGLLEGGIELVELSLKHFGDYAVLRSSK